MVMTQKTWRRPSRIWAVILCAFMFVQWLPLEARATDPITSDEVTVSDYEPFEGPQEESSGETLAPAGGEAAIASFYNWNDDKNAAVPGHRGIRRLRRISGRDA